MPISSEHEIGLFEILFIYYLMKKKNFTKWTQSQHNSLSLFKTIYLFVQNFIAKEKKTSRTFNQSFYNLLFTIWKFPTYLSQTLLTKKRKVLKTDSKISNSLFHYLKHSLFTVWLENNWQRNILNDRPKVSKINFFHHLKHPLFAICTERFIAKERKVL